MNGQTNCPSIGASWQPAAITDASDQKWYKPIITLNADSSGNRHVYKAFRFSRGLLGNYFRFLASHEFRMLKKVEHLDFTPDQACRPTDRLPTIHYRLIEGRPVKDIAAGNALPDNFFSQLFSDVKTLHQHGVGAGAGGTKTDRHDFVASLLLSRALRVIRIDFVSFCRALSYSLHFPSPFSVVSVWSVQY